MYGMRLKNGVTWMQKNRLAFLKDESGASALEYSLLLGLISLALVAVLTDVASGITTVFSILIEAMNNVLSQ